MTNRAVVTINGEADRSLVATWAKNVATGTIVEFRKKTRSHDQNAKLHAMLGEVAEQVVWYGRKLDADDWKSIFSASLRHAEVVPGIDRGSVVALGMRTSTMTIEEMGNLIELIYAFGADPAHPVNFKEPQTSEENAPSDDAGSDAGTPNGVASDIPAQADQPGEELEPSASSSSGSTLSDEDRTNLRDFIVRLCAAVGPEPEVITMARNSFAAEKRPLSQLAKEKAQTITGYFRSVCVGEIESADAVELACGIAQIDETALGIG